MRLYALDATDADAELVADRCWQAGAAGIWEVEGPAGSVVLRIGVDDADADAFLDALADRRPRDITDTDAVVLGTRSVVVGPADDPVTIQVPATVFGDGRHPTTATCLELLAALVTPGSRLLDVGAGSGALSVVAARAGADVTAIDIDPAAVGATIANAAANDVAVDASTAPLASLTGRWDVVVANISASSLLDLADDLRRARAPGGVLVVSGILTERWDEVRAALGGNVRAERDIEGWVTAVLED